MGSVVSHVLSDEDILSIGHLAIGKNCSRNKYTSEPAYSSKAVFPYSSLKLEEIDETDDDECGSDEQTLEEEHCETDQKSQVLDQNNNIEKDCSPSPQPTEPNKICEPEVIKELTLALAKPSKQGSKASSGVKKTGTISGTATPQKKIASPPAERTSSTQKGSHAPNKKEAPNSGVNLKSSLKTQNTSNKLCKENSSNGSILVHDEKIKGTTKPGLSSNNWESIDKRKSLLQITANFKPTDGQDLVKMKYILNLQTKEETFSSEASVESLIEFDLPMDKNGNPDPKLFSQSLPKLMNRFEGTVLLDGYLISMDTQQSQRFKVIGLDVHAKPPVLMIRPKNLKGVDIVRSSTKFEVRVESEFGPQDAKWIRIEGTKASEIKTLSPDGSGKLYILLA